MKSQTISYHSRTLLYHYLILSSNRYTNPHPLLTQSLKLVTSTPGDACPVETLDAGNSNCEHGVCYLVVKNNTA